MYKWFNKRKKRLERASRKEHLLHLTADCQRSTQTYHGNTPFRQNSARQATKADPPHVPNATRARNRPFGAPWPQSTSTHRPAERVHRSMHFCYLHCKIWKDPWPNSARRDSKSNWTRWLFSQIFAKYHCLYRVFQKKCNPFSFETREMIRYESFWRIPSESTIYLHSSDIQVGYINWIFHYSFDVFASMSCFRCRKVIGHLRRW